MAGFTVGFLLVIYCALLIRLAIVDTDRRNLRDKLSATEADLSTKTGTANSFYQNMIQERSRADGNYTEAKRHKERADKAERELAEANRKLGFIGRAITGPSELTEIEEMLNAGADAAQQAKRVCRYKTLAERRSQKPE